MDNYIVCRCEDVTFDDIRECTDDTGATDVGEAKRRLRVGMGTCQGRMCGPLLERCFGETAVGSLERNSIFRPVALSDIASANGDGQP